MKFNHTYVTGFGSHLPGNPVTNDEMDDFIRPVNDKSSRIKRRILKENGIKTRHYGIDKEGISQTSVVKMAGEAASLALKDAGIHQNDLNFIAMGSTGGDVTAPGLANMLQGELKAHPLETTSHAGICMSGMAAMKAGASFVELGEHSKGLVAASEFPSRIFKHTRFVDSGYDVDFDSHFLRWMLSDGSGALVLSNEPKPEGLSLKLNFIHSRSFSGDFPTCMQIGAPLDGSENSYLDYPSLSEAEKDGAYLLRQNIRILPHLFDVAASEMVKLVEEGTLKLQEVDHYLCHYSSEKLSETADEIMKKAEVSIPQEKWFRNLPRRGNTGSASIFIMLDDFVKEKNPQPGEKILCFIPESGRFSVSFMELEVVGTNATQPTATDTSVEIEMPESPALQLQTPSNHTAKLLRGLTGVWHEFRSEAWRSPMIQKIKSGQFRTEDYLRWMEQWIPQVREGSKWMRLAVENLKSPYDLIAETVEEHASEEQDDWKLLFKDYQKSGGTVEDADLLRRNRGGDAMNAFMYDRASRENAIDLLGSIFIIEGTGQKIIPALLTEMKRQTGLQPDCFRFLQYHGVNDEHHLLRWLDLVTMALETSGDPEATAHEILETARMTALLYTQQLKRI